MKEVIIGEIYKTKEYGDLIVIQFNHFDKKYYRKYYKVKFLEIGTYTICSDKSILEGTAKALLDKTINGKEMRYCRFCGQWKLKDNKHFAKNGKFYRTKCRACRNKTDRFNKVIEYKEINGITYQKCRKCGKWLISNKDNFPLITWEGNLIKEDGNLKTRGYCMECNNKILNKSWKRKQKRESKLFNDLTKEDWNMILNYFNNSCAYCGKTEEQNRVETCSEKRPSGFKLSKDHIIPVLNKDECKTTIGNIVPCCNRCNSSKGIKNFKEWYKKQDFFNEKRYSKIIEYIEQNIK